MNSSELEHETHADDDLEETSVNVHHCTLADLSLEVDETHNQRNHLDGTLEEERKIGTYNCLENSDLKDNRVSHVSEKGSLEQAHKLL